MDKFEFHGNVDIFEDIDHSEKLVLLLSGDKYDHSGRKAGFDFAFDVIFVVRFLSCCSFHGKGVFHVLCFCSVKPTFSRSRSHPPPPPPIAL